MTYSSDSSSGAPQRLDPSISVDRFDEPRPRHTRFRASQVSPLTELANSPKTPTKRPVPCLPCLKAQIEWTPDDGEPALCLERNCEFRYPLLLLELEKVDVGTEGV